MNEQLSWDALRRIHDHFAGTAKALCDAGKQVMGQLFIVGECSERSGAPEKLAALHPDLAAQFMRSQANKDAFAQLLKALLSPGHPLREALVEQAGFEPRVLVHVSEAWLSEPLTPAERIAADRGECPRLPSQSPNRRECVLIALHTRQGSIPVHHLIEDRPTRHCVLSPFPGPGTMHYSGRFAMQDAFGPEDSPRH